jgi:hypothetical protein
MSIESELSLQNEAAAQATGGGVSSEDTPTSLSSITPPGEVSAGDAGDTGPTLEEQAAAQDAPPEAPAVGSDVPLPEGLGDQWAGKSVADLMAAQAAAQAKITELSQQQAAAPEAEATAAAPTGDVLQEYADRFQQQGSLSETDVKALSEKTGIPEEMVVGYIQGETAKVQLAAQEVYGLTGGPENYEQMVQWMSRHGEANAVQQFNATLASNNLPQIKAAVQGMYASFQQAGGGPPTLTQGRGQGATGIEPFRSWSQVTQAMQKAAPDGTIYYETDPAYRAQVEARLNASNL